MGIVDSAARPDQSEAPEPTSRRPADGNLGAARAASSGAEGTPAAANDSGATPSPEAVNAQIGALVRKALNTTGLLTGKEQQDLQANHSRNSPQALAKINDAIQRKYSKPLADMAQKPASARTDEEKEILGNQEKLNGHIDSMENLMTLLTQCAEVLINGMHSGSAPGTAAPGTAEPAATSTRPDAASTDSAKKDDPARSDTTAGPTPHALPGAEVMEQYMKMFEQMQKQLLSLQQMITDMLTSQIEMLAQYTKKMGGIAASAV